MNAAVCEGSHGAQQQPSPYWPPPGATFRYKTSIFDGSVADAIAKGVSQALKRKTSDIAGLFTAQGFTWTDTKRKRTHLRLWFVRDKKLFEVQCDAKPDRFEQFKPHCLKVVDAFKALNATD